MNRHTLHQRLDTDCHVLGDVDDSTLLLHRNATLPWFILVPHTPHTELHDLDPAFYRQIMTTVHALSGFVKSRFNADKINIATIGNQVPQLHVHIIGRRHDDPYWPGVVWGQPETRLNYSKTRLDAIRASLAESFRLEPR